MYTCISTWIKEKPLNLFSLTEPYSVSCYNKYLYPDTPLTGNGLL